MNKVRIIVDSTADLPERFLSRVTVIPLVIRFGEEELADGVAITKERFYERLIEADELPTTSQATPAAFEHCFSEVAAAGDTAVVMTLASKLSGTYQSACIAAEEFDCIYVVDSETVAIGLGILTEYAVALAESGMSARDIAAELENKRNDVCVIALLDTLESLKRGGRISKATAVMGGLLNIKPVISVGNGEITVIGKARGSKQGNNLLVEKINASGGIDFDMPILLGYTGLTDVYLKKYADDSADIWRGKRDELDMTLLSGVIGTHTGPGVVGVAFFKNAN